MAGLLRNSGRKHGAPVHPQTCCGPLERARTAIRSHATAALVGSTKTAPDGRGAIAVAPRGSMGLAAISGLAVVSCGSMRPFLSIHIHLPSNLCANGLLDTTALLRNCDLGGLRGNP